VQSVTDKPLRRDAERNRQRILDAAVELFEQRGLDVSLNDIAHHAGVGVGTVYRRFPDKAQLIESLFEQKLEEIVALMHEAVADPDPWRGLTGFFERSLELQSKNSGLNELVLNNPEGFDRMGRIRSRLMPLGIQLVQRARASGQLRSDFEPQDLPIVQLMLRPLIDGAREIDPGLWRRYLQIFIQGLRADPQPPAPLSQPPLSHDDVDAVMSAAKLGRR
jgi:AcrR family transcriptional regulator